MIYYLTSGVFAMSKGIPNKRYTPEFKKMVVETMMKEKLSYRETARRFDVSSDTRIKDWERIYLTEGGDGFAVERRGRGSTCLLYTSPSPRDQRGSRMPSSA